MEYLRLSEGAEASKLQWRFSYLSRIIKSRGKSDNE